MKAEIPFSFRDHLKKGDPDVFAHRMEINQLLRQKGVPISVGGLDVMISLWTLPPSSCQFEGLYEDMVTLPKPLFSQPHEKIDVQKRHLKTLLEYLVNHKMIKVDKKDRYRMTKKGREIMEKAKLAIS